MLQCWHKTNLCINTVQVFHMQHRAVVTLGRKRCQNICQECQSHVAALCQGSVSRALYLHPRWRDEWEWSVGSVWWLPEKDRVVKSGEKSKTSYDMVCSRNLTPITTIFVIFHKGLSLQDALIFSEFKMRWLQDQRRRSDEKGLTAIVCFSLRRELFFLKSPTFSSDRGLFRSSPKSDCSTKRKKWDKDVWKTDWQCWENLTFSLCSVIYRNHPQCHCHCKWPPQSSWTTSPLRHPPRAVSPPGCTAAIQSCPADPEAQPGQTSLGVSACPWALSSWCSFQHSWGHWRPLGGSPPARWGHWPGWGAGIL